MKRNKSEFLKGWVSIDDFIVKAEIGDQITYEIVGRSRQYAIQQINSRTVKARQKGLIPNGAILTCRTCLAINHRTEEVTKFITITKKLRPMKGVIPDGAIFGDKEVDENEYV